MLLLQGKWGRRHTVHKLPRQLGSLSGDCGNKCAIHGIFSVTLSNFDAPILCSPNMEFRFIPQIGLPGLVVSGWSE